MSGDAIQLRLTRPLRGVAVRSGGADELPPQTDAAMAVQEPAPAAAAISAAQLAELERQQVHLQQTQGVLDDLVGKLMQLQEDMLATQRQDIARLAVQIARKVLMQEVRDGDYNIEQIIQEALKNAPMQQDVVVHLHPEDLQACQNLLQENPDRPMARLTLVGDAAVGRAECLLETPKGVVKSFIENHLDKIREALERAH